MTHFRSTQVILESDRAGSTAACWSCRCVSAMMILRGRGAERRDAQMEREEVKLTDRAVLFAAGKHAGQCRKGGTIPYITHVVEAMEIVSRITEDEEIRAAAVLHDTLEDTETSKEELERNFGGRVLKIVNAESENKRKDLPEKETWKIRKDETIEHLRRADTEIRMIALGDKLSNIRAMARDYRKTGEKLWERFNEKDPALHGWYYRSLAEIFEKDEFLGKTDECREYRRLCEEVFGGYGEKP